VPEDLANYRRIAFLFAVADELRPLASRLTSRSTLVIGDKKAIVGSLGSREVLLVAGGMGARCAARAAQSVMQSWLPGAFMMAGVAGALSPDLQRGDVMTAATVLTDETEFKPQLSVAGVTVGHLLSIDRVLVTSADKAMALKRFESVNGPLAVEMETAAAAAVAEHYEVPWGAIRAVSDSAEESLPLDFNQLRDRDGDLPVSTVALVAMRRPGRIPGLIRLGSATNQAAKALADALFGSLG
jgi:nucleoside phosphorylase